MRKSSGSRRPASSARRSRPATGSPRREPKMPGEKRAVIRGTGSSLPDKILTNLDLEKMVDTSDDWILSRTGIRERRVAREDEYMSQFATRAAEKALQSAGL